MQTRGKTRRAAQEKKEAQKEDDHQRLAAGDEGAAVEEEEIDEDNVTFDGVEVSKNVFCGGEGCALDAKGRRAKGITHVLSVSSNFEQRKPPNTKMVLSGHWLHFARENRPTANMLNILDDAVDYIDHVLASPKGGKVCVVSLEGASRAATVCAAYLIRSQKMSLRTATELLAAKSQRTTINRGFWRQLLVYEEVVRGTTSMTEEELPGAILFEKDELEAISTSFRESKRRAPRAEPMSPTTATGFGTLSLAGADVPKRKEFEWDAAGNDPGPEDEHRHRLKSPRGSIDQSDHTLETKV